MIFLTADSGNMRDLEKCVENTQQCSLCRILKIYTENVTKPADVYQLPFFHQLVEVLLHVLEHEVEFIALPDDLLQLDHVGMVEFLQGLGRERKI